MTDHDKAVRSVLAMYLVDTVRRNWASDPALDTDATDPAFQRGWERGSLFAVQCLVAHVCEALNLNYATLVQEAKDEAILKTVLILPPDDPGQIGAQ